MKTLAVRNGLWNALANAAGAVTGMLGSILIVRGLTTDDRAGRPPVTVISETAARRFWPAADPIGQRVWFGGGSNFDRPDSSAEVVGIVGDVADEPLDAPSNRASFYTPYRQFTYASRVVFVRTAGDPPSLLGAIREAVRSVDPDLPLYDVQTLEERIGGSWARHRFDAVLQPDPSGARHPIDRALLHVNTDLDVLAQLCGLKLAG